MSQRNVEEDEFIEVLEELIEEWRRQAALPCDCDMEAYAWDTCADKLESALAEWLG